MKENKNIEFINRIFRICEMGVVGIQDVIDKISKQEFREFLENQEEEYDTVLEEARNLLTAYGAEEKELSKMIKANSKAFSEMKLMKNDDDKIIADMMVKGTAKGIKKLAETMNSYNEEDEEAYALAEKLMEVLKNNLTGLKIYL